MFDDAEPTTSPAIEFVEGDFRDPSNTDFKRLMLSLMALQQPFDQDDEGELEAYIAGNSIDVVIEPARTTEREHIPARIRNADVLSPTHRLILEMILVAHHDTRLHENAETDPAISSFVFLPGTPGSGHERLDDTGEAERILTEFITGQGLTAADAAALIRPR